ncbi:hypothetical protein [Saccharothrix sp. HUAS TT1]|uniref:hypothetical protein n=1 Tax=unclassified Saccharothrix TaxID=2593673 RepID=UPI00345B8C6C
MSEFDPSIELADQVAEGPRKYETGADVIDHVMDLLRPKVQRWNLDRGVTLTEEQLGLRTLTTFGVMFPRFLDNLRAASPRLAAWLEQELVDEFENAEPLDA